MTSAAVIAVAMGFILRNTAGGIASVVGLIIVLPAIAHVLPSSWQHDYVPYLPSNAGGALYTDSKHALLGVVRQLAYELAPDVRVNGVAPGIAPTRLRGIDALGQERSDSVLDGTASVLPLQEVPSTEAYGGLYTLLANAADSGHMTGSMIVADSGLRIRGLARPGGRVL